MDLPNWALLPMWGATIIGAIMLSKEMLRRFG